MSNDNVEFISHEQAKLPGVFRIVCLPLNRAFFGESQFPRIAVREIVEKLDNGIFENQELQEDYDLYGDNNFELTYLKFDRILIQKEKRKKLLEDYKASWPGEVY